MLTVPMCGFIAVGALNLAVPSQAPPCAGIGLPPSDTTPVAAGGATEPKRELSVNWALLQLIPSFGLSAGERGAALRLAWQLTPLLYSFGVDPRLSPWRTGLVEPIVRHSGSVEVFAAGEFSSLGESPAAGFGYRAGLRGYLPLHQRGDYLSLSLGGGYLRAAGDESPEFELGVYVLFGFLGWTVHFAPDHDTLRWSLLTKIRFF